MLSLGSSLPGLDTSILWFRKLMRLNAGQGLSSVFCAERHEEGMCGREGVLEEAGALFHSR